jgi:Tol biopolymer transport system component
MPLFKRKQPARPMYPFTVPLFEFRLTEIKRECEVWVIHPDGSGLREITTASESTTNAFPVWSPDATKLLFERTNKRGEALWIADIDGNQLTKLTDIPGDTGYTWGTALVG